MLREEAKEAIEIGKKETYPYSIEDNVDEIIDQIFNDHEAQLKAKDEEIERLKAERNHFHDKYIQVGEYIGEWIKGTKSRSIVAMLFWMMKRQKAIYVKSFNELGINNHNTSFYKGAYENSKMRFKQAYKMLKDNA